MNWPDSTTTLEALLRWFHVLAGIAWIGLLYFFNLVNVPFMKEIDAATKGKVIPTLLPRALWWFRWAALLTFLSGLIYFKVYLIREGSMGPRLLTWLALTVAGYAVMYALLMPRFKLTGDGRVLAVALAVLSAVFMVVAYRLMAAHPGAGSHTVYIAVGGGFGTWMLLNVWGIIWRNQKRIIGWTRANAEHGTPMPAEAAALARQAFLASRTNAWLSLPMLFFMVFAAHGSLVWRP